MIRFKKVPLSSFSRNVASLMSGNFISQLIPLLFTPVLTRMFTPDEFGTLALYLAVVMLASALVTCRYELAIFLPKRLGQARLLAEISILLSFTLSCLLFLIIYLMENKIVVALELSNFGYCLYLLPISIFLASFIQILTNLKVRQAEYKQLNVARVSQTSSSSVFTVFIGLYSKFYGTLIIGSLIGQVFSAFSLLKGWQFSGRFRWLRVFATLRKYINFPKHLLPAHIINVIASNLPIIIVTATFGAGAAGAYSIVQRVFGLPSSVLSNSFGDVFRQNAAEIYKKTGECNELFVATLKKLIYIAIIPFSVFIFVAPNLFSLILGQEWIVAGYYAQILTPMFFIRFITMPLSSVLIITNNTNIDIYWQSSLLICGALSYFFSSSIELMLTYLSVSFSLCYLASLYINYRLSQKKGVSL